MGPVSPEGFRPPARRRVADTHLFAKLIACHGVLTGSVTSEFDPRLPTWVSPQVGSSLGYTGTANVIARTALDPESRGGAKVGCRELRDGLLAKR
jgi:hypothetical protein